jgi:hypothetical protein
MGARLQKYAYFLGFRGPDDSFNLFYAGFLDTFPNLKRG